jgi:hypothetical protein
MRRRLTADYTFNVAARRPSRLLDLQTSARQNLGRQTYGRKIRLRAVHWMRDLPSCRADPHRDSRLRHPSLRAVQRF